MIIDITIAVILIICIFIGDRKGFFLSFINTAGWIVSLIGSRIFQEPFKAYIAAHTNMQNDITAKVTEYIKERISLSMDDPSAAAGSLSESLAAILRNSANSTLNTAAQKAAAPVSEAIFSILMFVLLVIIIRLGVYLIERIICFFISESKALSSVNSILGMLLALVKGCILSFVLLIILFSTAVIGDIPVILDQINSSFICTLLTNAEIIPDVFTNFN